MQSFATPAPVSAVLDIPAARIRVVAAERDTTTVEVLPADPAKSRDVKAAEQITVDYADGVLRVEAAAPQSRILGPSGSVQVTVQLPAGSRLVAKTASGALRSAGPLGDVAFEGQQATVELDAAGSARLALMAGDVTVGQLGGHAEISTQQGDIRITAAAGGTVRLQTQAGDIEIGAAPGVSASLDAATGHGRTRNSLRNDGGTAALDIHATTAHGDITARSL
ncbi:DUF4097 family beta strand repeat-containing protein [Streptacidiphilus monticola]|uniref:DUF4097 family beta strand repeat-containing protein n=1 Tax=Streptacidiphilus monticola TaxID=2161674 RepID=A0ABW1G0B5_9ACTN